MSELDTIVEASLRSFYAAICPEWCGRENEAVNLYALGHLAKHVRPGTILYDMTQIGIEVTVRQVERCADYPNVGKTVRKDLVIWPTAGTTLWKDNIRNNEPMAVMEWKVNHFLSRAVHQQNRREHKGDIRWLRTTSLRSGMADFVGYAVLVENTHDPKTIRCVRVQGGTIDEGFLTIAAADATHGPL
jgi:hypothetical protein